jgi:hypothetical protein
VQKAIASGRIDTQPDGRIDPGIADVQWTETTRWGASNIMNAAEVGGDSSGHKPSEYAEARAKREHFTALRAELEYAERAGGLVRRHQVEEELFRTFRDFRDRMQNIPDRVAAIIAAKTDPAEIHQILSAEIRTALKRGLLDTASYVEQNARHDARRAIVIVTDDQTERSRNETAVLRALTRADSVLSALIAPDALHTGTAYRRPPSFDDDQPRDIFGVLIPRRFGAYPRGTRTQSAGTSQIANQSGGDSMAVDQAAAFEQTLERIRERYALYFYLPEGMRSNEEHSVEVLLTGTARRRYPGAEVRYRRLYLAPNVANDTEHARPI